MDLKSIHNKKENNLFTVIFTYSFDEDAASYLFSDINKAKEFLIGSAKEEYRIDKEENGFDADLIISDSSCYAKIINHFNDRDDITEFHLTNIYCL